MNIQKQDEKDIEHRPYLKNLLTSENLPDFKLCFYHLSGRCSAQKHLSKDHPSNPPHNRQWKPHSPQPLAQASHPLQNPSQSSNGDLPKPEESPSPSFSVRFFSKILPGTLKRILLKSSPLQSKLFPQAINYYTVHRSATWSPNHHHGCGQLLHHVFHAAHLSKQPGPPTCSRH